MSSHDATQQRILDVAMAIMKSDFASMQLYDSQRHGLRMITTRGIPAFFVEQFAWVYPESGTSCAMVLQTRQRGIITDIDTCDFVAVAREDLRKAGIYAMQSTPLCDADGRLIGTCSTHWRRPHKPRRAELRLFDVWTRQIAEVLLHDDDVSHLLHEAFVQVDRSRQLIDELEQLMARKVKPPRLH